MTRTRRVKPHPKDGGGGSATMFSSVTNLLNTITLCSIPDRGSSSFFALSQLTYPNAAVIFDAAIAIKCFGVGVSYMIIIGDLMPGVVEGFDSSATSIAYLMDRNFWITVFMLVIIPLSFLRRLDSLKYTSIIALVAIGYLIILVVYHFASDTLAPRDKIRVIQWGGPVEALASLPVIHPCRASVDAVLKWRPNAIAGAQGRTSSPNSRLLLPTTTRSDHGSSAPMSELRFAILTTILLVLAYTVALTVTSLERVLAYVGSTGSTAISFILPGLFYYKISDPDSIHHQRLLKEDDDALSVAASEDDHDDANNESGDGQLSESISSIRSGASGTNTKPKGHKSPWRWRTKWRWDMEHLDPVHLRRASLGLALYGFCVMLVCLVMNLVGTHAQ
ncbi:hypothetical protein RRF57_011954 [Xylaria bambusicola]|uniref:Amino acid transporter transmembrane domain-containing protein n=1 Tax=Xylaria bambusicola TaxID=326684 RepID=A0AAN7ZAH7_9PEZI